MRCVSALGVAASHIRDPEGTLSVSNSSEPLVVVRVGAYPHRIAETVAWERAEIERTGSMYSFVGSWDDPAAEALLPRADVVLCGYGQIGENRLAKLRRCRLLVVGSVGLDGIDVKAARSYGITICNMPDICVDEVAEHTMALLLAYVRKVVLLHHEVRNGLWQRDSLEPMPRIKGLTLGLIGAGRIGKAVAVRASAFGMRVLAYDPFIDTSADCGPIELASLELVTSSSDFISIHVPSTPETRHLISQRQLRSMKRSAIIINTARGAVIDETALTVALRNGWIRGAALDVLESEPPESLHPLFRDDRVLLTPHAAGFSDHVVDLIPRLAVSAVRRFMNGELPDQILQSDVTQLTARA